MTLKLLCDKAKEAACDHPVVLACLAAVALAGAATLLFWYIVFSGFAQPIAFIYSAF